MHSTYIKDFRLESGGFTKLQIIGEEGVHEMDLERLREKIQHEPAEYLPQLGAVEPLYVQLAQSNKLYVRRTAKNIVTISKA